MGTRAVYSFKDSENTFHVYKHWDGYPDGASMFIAKALPFAWELPRFEPDEFACAFIAGNKKPGGGDLRLTTGPEAHADLEYRYEIYMDGEELYVKAFEVNGTLGGLTGDGAQLYCGPQSLFHKAVAEGFHKPTSDDLHA